VPENGNKADKVEYGATENTEPVPLMNGAVAKPVSKKEPADEFILHGINYLPEFEKRRSEESEKRKSALFEVRHQHVDCELPSFSWRSSAISTAGLDPTKRADSSLPSPERETHAIKNPNEKMI